MNPEERAALPFDRSYQDAGYAPRPITMRADYEQLHEDTGYPLNAEFNEDEEREEEPRRKPPARCRPRDDYRENPEEPRDTYYSVDRESVNTGIALQSPAG